MPVSGEILAASSSLRRLAEIEIQLQDLLIRAWTYPEIARARRMPNVVIAARV